MIMRCVGHNHPASRESSLNFNLSTEVAIGADPGRKRDEAGNFGGNDRAYTLFSCAAAVNIVYLLCLGTMKNYSKLPTDVFS